MSQKTRPKLRFEEFESRLTPAVTRAIGTFQIRDTTARYDWVSGAANLSGTVVGADTLGASIDVTYTLTGGDFNQATTADGLTLEDEDVQWRELGRKRPRLIADREYGVTLKAPAGATAPFSVTVVIQFRTSIRNDDWKDPRNNTAFHQGWLKDGEAEQTTSRIDLTSVAANPGNQGGRNPGVPLRPTSPEVTPTQVGLLLSPALPTLGSAGYRLLAYSPNGTDYTFTAANSSGYGLFTASSPNLVEDGNGDWVLDPSTTLNPVYLDGSPTAGAYNGSNNDLVLRANSGGQAILLAGYTYSAVPTGLLTVADGETVTVAAEDLEDGDDMLWLNYRDGGGAGHDFVLVPIDSSDPQLTVSDVSVTEGSMGTTDATFTVSLSAAAASDVTVNYATVRGTASAGSDFAAASGTLTFLPGETTQTVTVPVAGNDTFEPDKDFFLTLSSATNAVIADGVGAGTIQNDDFQPTISIDDVTQLEGNSGTTTFVFTVTLSNPSWQTVTVDFATADGSATAGSDYAAASGTLTFGPGQTTRTISVTVYGDTVGEPGGIAGYPETFYLNLSAALNASITDDQGLGTIMDDD
jgi:hypothetical protein